MILGFPQFDFFKIRIIITPLAHNGTWQFLFLHTTSSPVLTLTLWQYDHISDEVLEALSCQPNCPTSQSGNTVVQEWESRLPDTKSRALRPVSQLEANALHPNQRQDGGPDEPRDQLWTTPLGSIPSAIHLPAPSFPHLENGTIAGASKAWS